MAAPVAGAEGTGLHVSVLSQEQAVYEGPATQVVAPAFNGQLGIRGLTVEPNLPVDVLGVYVYSPAGGTK